MRCYSARSLERAIGTYKRRIRSTLHPGVNAGNVLETRNIFAFIQSAGIIDFSIGPTSIDRPANFLEHPSNDQHRPQLWSPFLNHPVPLVFGQLYQKISQDPSYVLLDHCLLFWLKALLHCFVRLEGDRHIGFTKFHTDQTIKFSAKLWFNNQVLISHFYKSSNSSSSRGGEYMMFKAVHQNL